jgi:hypothetical protein
MISIGIGIGNLCEYLSFIILPTSKIIKATSAITKVAIFVVAIWEKISTSDLKGINILYCS